MATPSKKTKGSEPAQGAAPAGETVDWSQYADQATGFENLSQEDFGIPFLTVIQKGSPEVDKTHKDYPTKKIEGAEVGDIINTISRKIVHHFGEEPAIFIPCGCDKVHVEWRPRASGGGIVRNHRDSRILSEVVGKDESSRDILRNGNVLATTTYFFGLLILPDEEPQQCVIGMSSTQQKNSRLWLNLMNGIRIESPNGKFTPPIYSHRYKLSSKPESNAKGSWIGWSVSLGGMVTDRKLVNDAVVICKKVAALSRPAAITAGDGKDDDVPM